MESLDLIIIRHLLASPGQMWPTSQLAAILGRPERSVRRSISRVTVSRIAVRLKGGVTLSPYIVGELRNNKTALRNIEKQVEERKVKT